MILFGTGARLVEFDHVERRHCEHCGIDRNFVLRLKYEYGHFYHLFGWVMSREYQLACPVCTHGWRLEARSARALIGRDPVPFYQRAGWLVLLMLAILVVGAALARYERQSAPSRGDKRAPLTAASAPANVRNHVELG